LTRVGSISGHVLGGPNAQAIAVATLSFALLVGSAVSADDKKEDKKTAAATADVQKKETFTENQVAAELAKLATWCVAQNGPDDARRVLELGLQIYPENKALKKQKDEVKDAKQAPSKKYRDELKKKEHDAYEKCAKMIADLVVFAGDKGIWDHFEERVEAIAMKLGCEDALVPPKKGAIAVWFEPYRKWFNGADAKKLEAGGERIDGKWLSANEVAKLDEQHSKWSDPWVISDEVHEIKTTMHYRIAQQLLVHVGAYREMFIRYVSDGWELRKPEGKLPIVVTETQDDFKAQMIENGHMKKGDRVTMAAVYMHRLAPLNPVYVTFEPANDDGSTHKVDIEYVSEILQHEVTHQIATEYSYWNADHSTYGEDCHYWCVEGIATFMEVWRLGRSGWKLTHPNPKNAMTPGTGHQCAFANMKDQPDLPGTLTGHFNLKHDNFVRPDYYDIASTISYFLLEGEGRKYRKGYLKLLALRHEGKISTSSLEECFPGVDWKEAHEEYKKFVAGIKLDEVIKKD
jgi:hypothetical protein